MKHAPETTEGGTARFWVWECGGWVKLSLKPGQALAWGYWIRDEEGYSSYSVVWQHEGDCIRRQSEAGGRDCDGRHSESAEDFCPLTELHSRPAELYGWRDGRRTRAPYLDEKGSPLMRPDWRIARPVRVYDAFAQAAGY